MNSTELIDDPQQFGLRQEEASIISNFFFILFTPNPARQNVKIVIDGGVVETILSRDKFVRIIEVTCGLGMSNAVDSVCSDYGGYFLIDRDARTLKTLTQSATREFLTSTTLKNAQDEQLSKSESAMDRVVRKSSIEAFTSSFLPDTRKKVTQDVKLNLFRR